MNYSEFSKRYNPDKYKDREYIIPAEACDSLFNTHKITPDDTYRLAGNINCIGVDTVLQKHVVDFDGDTVVQYISQFKFPERINKLHMFTIESAYVAAKSTSRHEKMLQTVGLAFKLDMKILIHMKAINRKPVPKTNINKVAVLEMAAVSV